MLETVLGKKLTEQGFRIEEEEDIVYLYLRDKLIGKYSYMVTAEILRRDCETASTNN